MLRLLAVILSSTMLCCGRASYAEAAPPARRGSPAATTTTDEPASPAAALDPTPLDKVLRAHVRGGRVDYAALKADKRAQKLLDAFLAAAATMPEGAPLSAWLNVYNAIVIKLVLERYPIASVMDVPDFFKALKVRVAGKPRSLDAIEHQVIRPRFKDARVHFALNCGAVSCPELHGRAFVEATLDANLDALARKAVNDSTHVALRDGKLLLSAIFFWFEEDFVREAGSVVAWIKRFGGQRYAQLPADTPRVKRDYDWSLSDASQHARSPTR